MITQRFTCILSKCCVQEPILYRCGCKGAYVVLSCSLHHDIFFDVNQCILQQFTLSSYLKKKRQTVRRYNVLLPKPLKNG